MQYGDVPAGGKVPCSCTWGERRDADVTDRRFTSRGRYTQLGRKMAT